MRIIPDALLAEAYKLNPEGAWLWLVTVNLNGGQLYRLTTNNEDVTFGGETYYAYGLRIGEQDQSSDGQVSATSIVFDDASREIARLVDSYDGMEGASVTLTLVNSIDLSAAATSQTYKVQGAVVSTGSSPTVTITIGFEDMMGAPIPAGRYMRVCRWAYGSDLCGYDTTVAGALATCDKTLRGPNGCEAHGQDEVDRGITPVNHPLRFGGFPGLIRRN